MFSEVTISQSCKCLQTVNKVHENNEQTEHWFNYCIIAIIVAVKKGFKVAY